MLVCLAVCPSSCLVSELWHERDFFWTRDSGSNVLGLDSLLTVAGVVTNIRHSSHPSQASCLAGCHVTSPHTAVSHLLAPLIASLPLVPLVQLIVMFPHFSCHCLPSVDASASHCAIASRHAPLGSFVRLVKALPLLMLPPPFRRSIGSSQRSG